MTICGTDEYMAPEMLFDESFSYPADMFSFGEFCAMNPSPFACNCHARCWLINTVARTRALNYVWGYIARGFESVE